MQNPLVKRVSALRDKTDRDREGVFVIEGVKEIGHALENGIEMEKLLVCPEIAGRILLGWQAGGIVEVTERVYAKIAYRKRVGGVIAIAKRPQQDAGDIALPKDAFVLVVEGVEKPGNIGALLRTADGTGVNLVIIADEGGTDIYNPNVIRASLGAAFTVKTAVMSLKAALRWLDEQGIQVILTTPEAEKEYTEADYRGSVAVVLGSEARGLPNEALSREVMKIKIPMHGQMDSLNVSCTGAVMMYEVVRQRRGKP